MRKILCIFLLGAFISVTYGNINNHFIKMLTSLAKNRIDYIINNSGVNSQCKEDLTLVVSDAIQRKKWALSMIDASAKIESGLLHGNFFQIGNYDQCLSIKEVTENTQIKGQYCNILLTLVNGTNLVREFMGYTHLKDSHFENNKMSQVVAEMSKVVYGLCLPQSCTIENMQRIVNYAEKSLRINVHASFLDFLCDYEGKPAPNNIYDGYIFLFFGIIIAILIVATLYDIFIYQHSDTKEPSLIIAFSLYTNFKKFLSVKTGEDVIPCINGLKVITMFWIVLGHRFLLNAVTLPMNAIQLFDWKNSFVGSGIIGSTVIVDTFFTLSGLLLCYVFLLNKDRGLNLSTSALYLGRIIRLTPALIATILIHIGIMKYISDGPFWRPVMHRMSGACLKNWWLTLFHINNYFDQSQMCVEPTWYLSVDTQLYIISPIFLFSIVKKPIKMLTLLLTMLILSMIYSFYRSITEGLGSFIYDANGRHMAFMYFPTPIRMTPWIIGFITGYILYRYKDKQIYINKYLNVVLWIASFISICVIIWSILIFESVQTNKILIAAIYNSIARVIWGLCICWMVFSCVMGYGGIANKILSQPIFNVLVKLNYSMYLLHIPVMICMNARARTHTYYNNVTAVHNFFGDVWILTGICTVFTLAFESPIIALGKQYVNKLRKQSKSVTSTGTQITSKKKNKSKNTKYVVCIVKGQEDAFIKKLE